MEAYTIKAYSYNILHEIFVNNQDLHLLYDEFDKLVIWVERVVQKKLGPYKSDVQLLKRYHCIKTFVQDVLKQRVRQLSTAPATPVSKKRKHEVLDTLKPDVMPVLKQK